MPIDAQRHDTLITQRRGPMGTLFAAAVVGAAFGAGALLGGGTTARADQVSHQAVAGEAATASGLDVYAAADARDEALQETRSKLKLTFAHELTSKDAKEKPPPLAKAKKPAGKVEGAAVPLSSPPEPVVEAELTPKGTAKNKPDDDTDEAAAAEPAREVGPDKKRMEAALAKVLGDKPAPQDKRSFSLQVASTPMKDSADALQKKLQGQGHNVRVVEATLDGATSDGGAKHVYRVRVGPFGSREQADKYKDKLPMPTFVVSE